MSNSCCFITSNSRKYLPGLKWNQKRGNPFATKKGWFPQSNKTVCLWSLCEKHVFFWDLGSLGHYGPLGIFGGLTTVCTPPGEGRFSQLAPRIPGGSSSLLVEMSGGMPDLCQIYVSWGPLEDSTSHAFFFKHGGVSNLNTGCHGLQKRAHQIQ